MRVIEGTVDEIVQYQQQMGNKTADGAEATVVGEAQDEEALVDRKVPASRTVEGSLDNEDDEDAFFITRHVYGRANSPATARRILKFLDDVATKSTKIELGESERTKDGFSDYLMVRDTLSNRFGAVVYVKPKDGGLSLRLKAEDVTDIDDGRVKLRNVQASQQYAVNCPLNDDLAVELALELTDRALAKVRAVEA